MAYSIVYLKYTYNTYMPYIYKHIYFSFGRTTKLGDLGFLCQTLFVDLFFMYVFFSIYVLFNKINVCNNAPNIVRVCYCGLVQYDFNFL